MLSKILQWLLQWTIFMNNFPALSLSRLGTFLNLPNSYENSSNYFWSSRIRKEFSDIFEWGRDMVNSPKRLRKKPNYRCISRQDNSYNIGFWAPGVPKIKILCANIYVLYSIWGRLFCRNILSSAWIPAGMDWYRCGTTYSKEWIQIPANDQIRYELIRFFVL